MPGAQSRAKKESVTCQVAGCSHEKGSQTILLKSSYKAHLRLKHPNKNENDPCGFFTKIQTKINFFKERTRERSRSPLRWPPSPARTLAENIFPLNRSRSPSPVFYEGSTVDEDICDLAQNRDDESFEESVVLNEVQVCHSEVTRKHIEPYRVVHQRHISKTKNGYYEIVV